MFMLFNAMLSAGCNSEAMSRVIPTKAIGLKNWKYFVKGVA